ncbi:hypothetical protein GYN07_02880 [Rhizobium leguminosarum bv. viciae 248]|uniref:hypothetical protein n=1 Tax=Rhizobium TaxID=379 RepID=UPI00036029F1|nr:MULTISPECIES: hypothetical protein [Rhizobium]MBY3185954.1 hypothetical protein [Rhizobium laguerreae]MBY5817332.1 hypothetical protein [Rhizobium leguminosarum]MBY5836712.1 hypothetical protein [Rhizobium leguminosarum]MBY5869149.1 hypothetical protein [Rhizobium leguminosarum]MCA2410391.1 hypothetical protein [Rhizobium leguminosarum]
MTEDRRRPLLDVIAEHAYDKRDIEIFRRITTTRTVREIYNHSPAETLNAEADSNQRSSFPDAIETPIAGRFRKRFAGRCAENEEM